MKKARKIAKELRKTHFKLLFAGVFLLILFSFFLTGTSFATETGYLIDFEGADVGNLNTQTADFYEHFYRPSGSSYDVSVEEEEGNKFGRFWSSYHTGTSQINTGYLGGTNLKDRYFVHDVYLDSVGAETGLGTSVRVQKIVDSDWEWTFGHSIVSGEPVSWLYTGTEYLYYIEWNDYDIPYDTFIKFIVEYDWEEEEFRVKLLDYTDWTDWTSLPSKGGTYTPGIRFYLRYGGRVDNITNMIEEEEEEIFWPYWLWDYDMNLEIDYPEVGSETELITGNATTSGSWAVLENSSLYWDKIIAIVKDMSSGQATSFTQEINGEAGNSGSFSIPIEGLSDGNYSLCWASTGTDTGRTWWTRWAYFYCDETQRTILRVGDFPELPRYVLLEQLDPCVFEDCSELSALSVERYSCQIQNFLTNLTCPDPEKLIELRFSIDQIKSRFPASYLRLAREEFNFLREEIPNKESLSITIFENDAEINVNFFDSVEDENETSLMDYFRWFFGGLIVLSFIVYGLNFIKRIF